MIAMIDNDSFFLVSTMVDYDHCDNDDHNNEYPDNDDHDNDYHDNDHHDNATTYESLDQSTGARPPLHGGGTHQSQQHRHHSRHF